MEYRYTRGYKILLSNHLAHGIRRITYNMQKKLRKGLSIEEKTLLKLLRNAISDKAGKYQVKESCDWEAVLELARGHAVTAVLYDVLAVQEKCPATLLNQVKQYSQITVLSNYRLLFLNKYLTEYLDQHNIQAITLKGCVTAALYPVPEYRKSGDIDLLIPKKEDYQRACRLLQDAGLHCLEKQSSPHHTELETIEGIVVEVHGMLAAPFENNRMNEYLQTLLMSFSENMTENKSWGVRLYQPSDAYHAFYLALHMLQHFLREGFGLKNLCDWTVFWNRNIAKGVKQKFLKLVSESGMGQFVRVLTAACVRYMGLPKERVAFIFTEPVQKDAVFLFIQEVLDAGEFGRSEKDRMVVMQGTGAFAFVQEFHHQMHVSYPRAGCIFVCWPVLWVLTLVRFLSNNRRLHRGSAIQIMHKARRRSKLTKQLRLFGK